MYRKAVEASILEQQEEEKKEAARQAIIKRERVRLLRENAEHLRRFLPKRMLQDKEDFEAVWGEIVEPAAQLAQSNPWYVRVGIVCSLHTGWADSHPSDRSLIPGNRPATLTEALPSLPPATLVSRLEARHKASTPTSPRSARQTPTLSQLSRPLCRPLRTPPPVC